MKIDKSIFVNAVIFLEPWVQGVHALDNTPIILEKGGVSAINRDATFRMAIRVPNIKGDPVIVPACVLKEWLFMSQKPEPEHFSLTIDNDYVNFQNGKHYLSVSNLTSNYAAVFEYLAKERDLPLIGGTKYTGIHKHKRFFCQCREIDAPISLSVQGSMIKFSTFFNTAIVKCGSIYENAPPIKIPHDAARALSALLDQQHFFRLVPPDLISFFWDKKNLRVNSPNWNFTCVVSS